MNKNYGQRSFGKPLPAGAFGGRRPEGLCPGGRERPYTQNFRPEIQISKQLDLAQLSSAILKNGENAGPLGQILALTAVMTLITACGSATAVSPEASHAPTPTPDNPTPVLPTHTLTPTSTHTLTPTSTLFPSPFRTPTFAAPEKPSQYSAADNNVADLSGGIARLDEGRYKARLVQSSRAIKADPNHRFLDYEAAMEFLNPQKDFWGKAKLPSRGQDFWITGNGGLGFTESDLTHFGMGQVLDATADNLLAKGGDDLYRGRMVVQQKYFEVGLIQAVRAAAKLRWSSEDFTKFGPGSALANHDGEIRSLFNQIISDLGYEPVGGINWPGAVDLKTLDETELANIVPDGNDCVAERPSAGSRKDQKPEQFRKVAFRGGVESRSLGQDENRFLVDSENDQVILVVVDTKGSWKSNGNIRVEVLDAGASIDRLQPERKGQNVSDAQEVKEVDAALDRLVPCGPAAAGPESSKTPTTTTTLDVKISLTPQNTPPKGETSTPPKNVTPGTPGTPEKTQPPVTPQNTPEKRTPEGGVPTVVPPGPQPTGQPTFIPRPPESTPVPKTVPTSTY